MERRINFTYNLREDFIKFASMSLTNVEQTKEDGTIISTSAFSLTPKIEEIISFIQKNNTGVMLRGNVGCGKTFIMDILLRIIHPQDERKFSKINAIDLITEFNTTGHEALKKIEKKNVFFDDLGSETRGKYYGENIDVFEKIIQIRYNDYRDFGVKTHFTTNLTKKEMSERYGARVVSRITEMCEVINIGSQKEDHDLRLSKNFIGYPIFNHPKIKTEEDIKWEKQYKEMTERAQNEERKNEYQGIGTRLKKQWKILRPDSGLA